MSDAGKGSYLKAPKLSSRLFTTDRLYYNAQHLLVVESGYFQDTYRKIAFTDVCGFSICESKRRLVWGVVWAVVAAVFGIFCVTTEFQVPALIVFAGIGVASLIVNLTLGKSYRCTLSTAFSDVPLKTITRKRRAFQFKAFLDEKVSEAQGLLNSEAARELIEAKIEKSRRQTLSEKQSESSSLKEMGPDASVAPIGAGEAALPVSIPPPLPAVGRLNKWHWAFSALTGVLGLSSIGNYVFSWYPAMITGLVFAVSMIVSIFAVARKIDTEKGASLGNVFKGGVGFHFAAAVAAYVVWMITLYGDHGGYEGNPLEMYRLEGPLADMLFLFSGIIALVFSGIAAVKMARFDD